MIAHSGTTNRGEDNARVGRTARHAIDHRTITVAFFAAAMFTQSFDNVMLPPNTQVLGTPNKTVESLGAVGYGGATKSRR